MFRIAKPNREAIEAYIAAQKGEPHSYPEAGRTREAPAAVAGYTVDHNRIQLGAGREAFERAKRAIQVWKMFEMPWVQICWPTAPIVVGTDVAMMAKHFGFWSLNPCRIVYVLDEDSAGIERYGFAYGTLRGHAEIGEERFSVEFHQADASVWYDLYAFSRPGPVARMGAQLARRLQAQFVRESKVAMLSAVQNP
jgi:uncharacterized protein (UPF0548 family)